MNDSMQPNFHQFKCVMLGKWSVGKTSILQRLVKNQFKEYYEATIGAHFHSHTTYINDVVVKFDFWDTAGEERFQSIIPFYFKGAHAVTAVYDIQCHKSFEFAEYWISRVKQNSPNAVIALIGNKIDLEDKRMVTFREVETYAQHNDLLFMELSARNGQNVAEFFSAFSKKVLSKCNRVQQIPKGIIHLEETENKRKRKRCC